MNIMNPWAIVVVAIILLAFSVTLNVFSLKKINEDLSSANATCPPCPTVDCPDIAPCHCDYPTDQLEYNITQIMELLSQDKWYSVVGSESQDFLDIEPRVGFMKLRLVPSGPMSERYGHPGVYNLSYTLLYSIYDCDKNLIQDYSISFRGGIISQNSVDGSLAFFAPSGMVRFSHSWVHHGTLELQITARDHIFEVLLFDINEHFGDLDVPFSETTYKANHCHPVYAQESEPEL